MHKAMAKGSKAAVAKNYKWELRLYVAGNTPKSVAALSNL
jgi:circadian clock protein KaiB